MESIFYNIIGGIIVAGLTWLIIWLGRLIEKWYIRKLFGNDFRKDGTYQIIYAQFRLKDSCAKESFPYKKPDKQDAEHGFSIENPISGCEVRSINYFASLFGKHRAAAPHISLDTAIDKRLDLSFIALGGPLSNYKTKDVQNNPSNIFVKIKTELDKTFFVTAKDDIPVLNYEQEYDYGLILRIRPSQFSEKVWIVCAGIGEWGTSGASYYLCRRWRELIRKNQKWHNIFGLRKDSDFAAIVKVRLGQDESAELVRLYRAKEEVESDAAIIKDERMNLAKKVSGLTSTPPASGCGPE